MAGLQAGAALYKRLDTLHVNVDQEYLAIDAFQDAITAGPMGLARLLGGNTFEDRNTFQDIVCQSIEVVSDENAKYNIASYDPPDASVVSAALLALKVCTFQYKEGDDRLRLGMLAQDFGRETNGLGVGSKKNTGSIDYLTVINLMLFQLQRLTLRVQELEGHVKGSQPTRPGEETPTQCNKS
jgi:hypothetical protein